MSNVYDNSLIIIGGDKGGVGKSLVTTCVIDLLVQSGRKIVVTDTDDKNSDIYLAFKKADKPTDDDEPNIIECLFQPLDKEKDASRIGEIIEEYPNNIIVINSAARSEFTSYAPVFADICREQKRGLLTFWPINLDIDSMNAALDYFEACEDYENSKFFIVLNGFFGEPRDFRTFQNHKNEKFRKAALTIEIPLLSPVAMEKFRSNRLTFANYNKKLNKDGNYFLTTTDRSLVALFRRKVRESMKPFIDILEGKKDEQQN